MTNFNWYFIGKRVEDGIWVEGLLSKTVVPGEAHICQIKSNYSIINHKVYPESVGIYTGKNLLGKFKIFEGTVLKYYFKDDPNYINIGVVKYDSFNSCFTVVTKNGAIKFEDFLDDVCFRVLGMEFDMPGWENLKTGWID